jgi:hypothetical protein
MSIDNITKREQLMAFVERAGMRRWHEPDESGVDAFPAVGSSFDNACASPLDFELRWAREFAPGEGADVVVQIHQRVEAAEHGVFLFHNSEPVAFVNLAMLFAFATGMTE